MQTLFFLYVGSSLLLALIALPLMARKSKPNPFYGFRIRKTLESPEVWYEVNQFFGKRLFVTGVAQAIICLALYTMQGISVDVYALSCLSAFVILFSIAMAQSFRHIKSLN